MHRSRRRRLGAATLVLAIMAAHGMFASIASGAAVGGYWLVGADGGVYEFGGARPSRGR